MSFIQRTVSRGKRKIHAFSLCTHASLHFRTTQFKCLNLNNPNEAAEVSERVLYLISNLSSTILFLRSDEKVRLLMEKQFFSCIDRRISQQQQQRSHFFLQCCVKLKLFPKSALCVSLFPEKSHHAHILRVPPCSNTVRCSWTKFIFTVQCDMVNFLHGSMDLYEE